MKHVLIFLYFIVICNVNSQQIPTTGFSPPDTPPLERQNGGQVPPVLALFQTLQTFGRFFTGALGNFGGGNSGRNNLNQPSSPNPFQFFFPRRPTMRPDLTSNSIEAPPTMISPTISLQGLQQSPDPSRSPPTIFALPLQAFNLFTRLFTPNRQNDRVTNSFAESLLNTLFNNRRNNVTSNNNAFNEAVGG